MEMSDCSNGVSAHHPEFINIPVRIVRLVQNGDLNITIIHGVSIKRPIVVALLASLLYTPGKHHDGAGVCFPTHSPEVVSGRVQRSLCDDKFSFGIESWHKTSVDEIAPLFIIRGLKFDPTVVVRQDICEPILGPIYWQVRSSAQLVPTNMLEFLVFFAESEVAVSRHDSIMFGKVFQFDWS